MENRLRAAMEPSNSRRRLQLLLPLSLVRRAMKSVKLSVKPRSLPLLMLRLLPKRVVNLVLRRLSLRWQRRQRKSSSWNASKKKSSQSTKTSIATRDWTQLLNQRSSLRSRWLRTSARPKSIFWSLVLASPTTVATRTMLHAVVSRKVRPTTWPRLVHATTSSGRPSSLISLPTALFASQPVVNSSRTSKL